MSEGLRRGVDTHLQQRVHYTDTHVHISDPPAFSLVKFLFDQGFEKETVYTAAIADINERLIKEEARIMAVETSLLAQAHVDLTKLTRLLPATAKLADIFVARNQSKFSNMRNHTRQAACQAALGALPKPPKKARPTAEARSILQAFWDAGGTAPNVDQRLMLACHAHLTFNQVRFRIAARSLFSPLHRSRFSSRVPAPRARLRPHLPPPNRRPRRRRALPRRQSARACSRRNRAPRLAQSTTRCPSPRGPLRRRLRRLCRPLRATRFRRRRRRRRRRRVPS
jgi:hypothetical protein